MIVFVALDDNNGMLFNHRRQSRDAVVRERMFEMAEGKPILMNAYSARLFPDAVGIKVSESFLEEAQQGDYCFVENVPLAPFESKIEKLIIYRWNRLYPADTYLDLSLEGKKKVRSLDFIGSSHEKITEEVFER